MSDTRSVDDLIASLYEIYAGGGISRRDFMRRATVLGVAGAAAAALGPLGANPAQAASLAQAALAQLSAAKTLPLDVAEWSYMWVNVKRADTARGSFIGGQQMYVEYMVPARVRKPFPIVLVHGGGGQGSHWMGTPDGRPGWMQHLVAEGYKVYVVDRPGHGRAPQHPDTHGGIPTRPSTMEAAQALLIPPVGGANNPNPYRRKHTQWPGTGAIGSPEVAQFLSSQGGSYLVTPPPPAGAAAGPTPAAAGGAATAGPPVPANQQPEGPLTAEHMEWRAAGAELLDKIGPAIIVTHANAGAFGLFVAEARPNLVKAAVMYEGGGISGFSPGHRWGVSTIPVTWDPPVKDPAEIKTRWVANPEPDVAGYFLQEEPARRLPNLRNVAVLHVSAEAGQGAPGNPGLPAFLKQAGVRVAEELRLADVGVYGNGHIMMLEKNHREALQPVLDWLDKNVRGSEPALRKRGTESTAMRLSNMGYFWVGPEVTKKDYGTVVVGQMYVQHLIPEQIRQPFPIVLVHGGGGQSTHYMGLDGNAGWAHYHVQNGYQVYLVDRPGHGRSPAALDAIGPIGNVSMHHAISADLARSAATTPRRWMGTGQVGDPLLEQIIAGQNAAPQNTELMERLWRTRGAELLEKIGPAIIQTHSAGGPFGFFVANERPALTKAVVCYEGLAGPVLGQNNQPNLLPNLKGIPIMYLTAENSRFATLGQPITDALLKSGALAEHIHLGDRGIKGNSHFAMFETNRKEVFEVIRGWIESKLPPNPPSRQTTRG